jgi:hypothetical protein
MSSVLWYTVPNHWKGNRGWRVWFDNGRVAAGSYRISVQDLRSGRAVETIEWILERERQLRAQPPEYRQ